MKSLLIGVLGHVDHGKTALVRALTGIETDRLKEERERGLSIVLGFAHLPSGHSEIDLIDMPGHERFLRTMISGATGIDAALLVVDAKEGVKPQTVEHLEVARLIGVRRAVIAVTKIDVASQDQAQRVAAEARAVTAANGMIDAGCVLTSALTGQGLEDLKRCLAELLETQADKAERGVFYLPVDRVFTAPGFGTVVTGTLRRGRLAVGDEVEMLPTGQRTRVRGLEVHNRTVKAVEPGRRVAVNLRGTDRAGIERGHALATPESIVPSPWLDASLQILESSPRPLANGQSVQLLFGTSDIPARVRLLEAGRVDPGRDAFVQLRCQEPVVVPAGEPFVIRSFSPARTIGGGRIQALTDRRLRHGDAGVIAYLRMLSEDDPPAKVAGHLRRAGYSGSTLADLARLVGYAPGRVRQWLEEIAAEILPDGTAVHRDALEALSAEIIATLDQWHRERPGEPGVPLDSLSRMVNHSVPSALQAALMTTLIARGEIIQSGSLVRRRSFRPDSASLQAAADLASRLEELFLVRGLTPPDVQEVIGKGARWQKTLRDLVRRGVLVVTFDRVQKRQIVFHEMAVQRARKILTEQLSTQAFTVGEAGGVLGISRKYSVPLLEHLDARNWTRRNGDRRIVLRTEDAAA